MLRTIALTAILISANAYATLRYPLKDVRSVYIAGPLFTDSERLEAEKIADALQSAGFKTFVPHRDGFLVVNLNRYMVDVMKFDPNHVKAWTASAVDALDVYQVVEGNGSLVMNANGRVPDEGAIAELSMAWILGKPVIIYRNDSRSLTNGINNPILMGRTNFEEVSDYSQIAAALSKRISELKPDPGYAIDLAPHVLSKVEQGEILMQAILKYGSQDDKHLSETIATLYGGGCLVGLHP